MILYMYALQGAYLSRLASTFTISQNYSCVVRTFEVYLLRNFQIDSIVLSTVDTLLDLKSPELSLKLDIGTLSSPPSHSFFFFKFKQMSWL